MDVAIPRWPHPYAKVSPAGALVVQASAIRLWARNIHGVYTHISSQKGTCLPQKSARQWKGCQKPGGS
jgi:hypothetical protein